MEIKQGNAFSIYINCKDSEGNPVAYDEISCQVKRNSDELVESLTVTPTETTGRYLLSSAGTDTWPLETLKSDIRIVSGGKPINSEPFEIKVVKPITEAV